MKNFSNKAVIWYRKTNTMKRLSTLEIYNIIAVVIIIAPSFLCFNLYQDLKETEELLQQCESKYYELLK